MAGVRLFIEHAEMIKRSRAPQLFFSLHRLSPILTHFSFLLKLKKIHLLALMCVGKHVCVYVYVCVSSEVNLQKSVLSFHRVIQPSNSG